MDELEIKNLLGKRIKDLRLKKNLTQEQLAEAISIGERNLSKIECGKVFLKSKTLAKLIDTLEVTPDELFDFSNYQKKCDIKQILIDEIQRENVDLELLYKIYRAIKY